ncbi:DUF6214 family protein [Streptomyces sp. DH24]|uniref:DUF6214 family protein n=1 Tax=Streptomyces sp. DH24 TaxID=3040123 RepID=UPI00244348A0|nr:DUF6214 family protein [Streptomyces sp. DH24]MDG9718307.1 DUF6214 family protein [Streptomyces sp. DH24]
MRPAWEVREGDGATSWFDVRLEFADGARVDALAVRCGRGVSLEDVRARPALSLDDLAALADWLEGPLAEACGVARRPEGAGTGDDTGLVAREYRAAQEKGTDPVLAVMKATGRDRRGALRLIGRARDAGLLTPRHHRR